MEEREGVRHYRLLSKVSGAAHTANTFGLFRTGNGLERLQRDLARFPALSEEARHNKAKNIIGHAVHVETVLEDEHSDVSIAGDVAGKGRRALIASCSLFAAQLCTLAVAALKPWLTPEILEEYHPTTIAGAVILALAIIPARSFLSVYRFGKAKETIGIALQDVKATMREERDKAGN